MTNDSKNKQYDRQFDQARSRDNSALTEQTDNKRLIKNENDHRAREPAY